MASFCYLQGWTTDIQSFFSQKCHSIKLESPLLPTQLRAQIWQNDLKAILFPYLLLTCMQFLLIGQPLEFPIDCCHVIEIITTFGH